jgi:hypothetical protein
VLFKSIKKRIIRRERSDETGTPRALGPSFLEVLSGENGADASFP